MPILAATIGVLGGVLGALTGGWIANHGQEKRFETERTAAIHDLRLETYGTFLGAAEEVSLALQEKSPDAEKRAAVRRLLIANARVGLVADNPEVLGQAALNATNALERWDKAQTKKLEHQALADYGHDIKRFAKLARHELEATKE